MGDAAIDNLATTHRSMLLDEFPAIRRQAEAALVLFDEGATLPFIARYRKERTGGLTEIQLKEIQDKRDLFAKLAARKGTILKSIDQQGKLTAELQKSIVDCTNKDRLEDLYLPYKPRRRTRAQIAREKGYEPLADEIWNHRPASGDEEAMAGAMDIIAERIAEDPEIREWVREQTAKTGQFRSKKRRGAKGDLSKFEMYFDFQEPLSRLASHRVLAMWRGERESALSVGISVDERPILDRINRTFNRQNSPHRRAFRACIEDAYKRLIAPSIENEVRAHVWERAEHEAFRVFRENLRNLLLAPPVRGRVILGIDPGLRTGCKVVVIDKHGRFQENTVIFPERSNTADVLATLVCKYAVEMIAIGNGTGSREVEAFLRKANLGPTLVSVSEAGASVYSASETAVQEHPDLDVTVRGAISIARRLQEPLAELVKIDPKAIGVGQYQHDVDQEQLKKELDGVVESCVNAVGVNVNTASVELLSYVAGLNRKVAQNITTRRPFLTREALRKVPRLGPRAFEQAAGFLRIPDAENPLDASAVHPESYYVVQKIARKLGRSTKDLIGATLSVRPEDYTDEAVGVPTVRDILEELKKPGRDLRKEFVAAKFDDTVHEIEDLKEGVVLEGSVTNVTGFGAFVDIGVHQDGLVHISELANRFVQDANKVVHLGQVVKVKVLSVDTARRRITLSMKQA